MTAKEKQRICKEMAQAVLSRKSRLCNVLEYKGMFSTLACLKMTSTHSQTYNCLALSTHVDYKVVYRR